MNKMIKDLLQLCYQHQIISKYQINGIINLNYKITINKLQHSYKLLKEQYQIKNGNMIQHYNVNKNKQLQFDIPEKWHHDPQIKDNDNHTVEDQLIYKDILVPKQWQTNPKRKLTDEDKQIIEDYCDYYNIQANYSISPTYNINSDKNTIAMYLADNKQDVPEKWRHDPILINKYGQTVALIYAENDRVPPKEWEHDPNIQEGNKMTVAMRLAHNGIIPPAQWYHKPELKDKNGMTVAMFIAQDCKQIPDQQWNHDPNIQNKIGETVAMKLASKKIIPPQQWYHNPNLQEHENYMTTAMYILQYCNQLPDKHWNHNPEIQDLKGMTVAMYIVVLLKQIPEDCWNHDPKITNISGRTVGIFIIYILHQIPPQQWMYDPFYKNKHGESLNKLLEEQGHTQQNGQYVLNCQIETLDDTCCLCHQSGQQEFLKSTCNHKICVNCFQTLLQKGKEYLCPICDKYDWYLKINDNQDDDVENFESFGESSDESTDDLLNGHISINLLDLMKMINNNSSNEDEKIEMLMKFFESINK